MMKVNLVGCGIIGQTILEDMTKAKLDVIYGTDIDPKIINVLKKKGYNVSDQIIPDCDVYIISVLTTDQVLDVIEKIPIKHNPLVVIESTIEPGTVESILKSKIDLNLVVFPHRYYDKDPTKRVFNLNRVMGAVDELTLQKALDFYTRYMDKNLIRTTDIGTAEICKPVENMMRFVEIALAEMLKVNLEEKGYDFKELRECVNTKWNIDLKDAVDGIGGHCLNKDTKMMNNLLAGNLLIKAAMEEDIIYKEMVRQWKKQSIKK